MTLLVRRGTLLTLILGVVAAVLVVGVIGYGAVRAVAAGGYEPKALSERVLFIAIVAATLALALGVAAIGRGYRLSATLQKLVDMNRLTGFSPENALGKMGDVGRILLALYRQLNDLSEKKSVKISSLTALNEYLLASTREMIIVSDATGRVLQASRPLLDRLSESRVGVVGAYLDTLVPGAETSSAVIEMGRTKLPIVRDRRGDSIVLAPVLNRSGEVAYVVVTLTRTVTDELRQRAATAGARAEPAHTARRSEGVFSRLFRRRSH